MTIEARNKSLAKEYTELKATIAPLEKRVKELKAFFDELTGKTDLDLGTWLVHYTPRNSVKVDIEALAKDHPEIDLTKYEVASTTYALSIKKK